MGANVARPTRSREPSVPRPLSELSSPPIPNSHFFSNEFMLAASMVIIQPSSGKIVVVNDTNTKSWFLPRGRKDVGESLEQCALREAYEEVKRISSREVMSNSLELVWISGRIPPGDHKLSSPLRTGAAPEYHIHGSLGARHQHRTYIHHHAEMGPS